MPSDFRKICRCYKAFQALGVSGSPQIPGQIVFFAPNAGNGQQAHTGIYIGNGNFISVTSNGVKQYSLTWWSNNVAKYVGYANPPLIGRADNNKTGK